MLIKTFLTEKLAMSFIQDAEESYANLGQECPFYVVDRNVFSGCFEVIDYS